MHNPNQIWNRYELNIDRIRANLPIEDQTAYRKAIRWLFDNPITDDSSTNNHLTALRLLRVCDAIERMAERRRVVVGICNWPEGSDE